MGWEGTFATWRLQDVFSLRGLCAQLKQPRVIPCVASTSHKQGVSKWDANYRLPTGSCSSPQNNTVVGGGDLRDPLIRAPIGPSAGLPECNTRGGEWHLLNLAFTRLFYFEAYAHKSTGQLLLSLYKIVLHFQAWLWESIILLFPTTNYKAHAIETLLHAHCAIYASPPTSPVYAIHHTILVMAICKGQVIAPYPYCQHGCNTVAIRWRNIRPLSDPPFLCQTPYKNA